MNVMENTSHSLNYTSVIKLCLTTYLLLVLHIFSKNTEISNFNNSVQWEPSFSVRTGVMKVIVAFRVL